MKNYTIRRQQLYIVKNMEKLKKIAKVICVSDHSPIAEFEINGVFGLFWLHTGEFYYKQSYGEGIEELDWLIC